MAARCYYSSSADMLRSATAALLLTAAIALAQAVVAAAAATAANAGPPAATLVRHTNGTLLKLHLGPYSSQLDSGTTVYRFPHHRHPELAASDAWRLLTPSDTFFLANQRDLVTSRRLTPADARRTYELLATNDVDAEETPEMESLKISVTDYGDEVRFAQDTFDAIVVENSKPGTEILALDKDLAMINGEGVQKFALERNNSKRRTDEKEPVKLILNGGVIWLVVGGPIDYEETPSLEYRIVALDGDEDLASATVKIRVLNEDDNLPEFAEPTVYYFVYNPLHAVGRYPVVGRVSAVDADGDKLVYQIRGEVAGHSRPRGCCLVVPQTGQVIVVNGDFNSTAFSVDAAEKDDRVRAMLK